MGELIPCRLYTIQNKMSLLLVKKIGKLMLTKFSLDGAMASIYLRIQEQSFWRSHEKAAPGIAHLFLLHHFHNTPESGKAIHPTHSNVQSHPTHFRDGDAILLNDGRFAFPMTGELFREWNS